MHKVGRKALATALLVVFCSTGVASAATSEDRDGPGLFSRIKNRVVKILDDIRMGFPGG